MSWSSERVRRGCPRPWRRDLGASVMVVEANFDTGGRAL
jgi:hypothetical protein